MNQELQNGKVVVQNSYSESGDDKNGDEDDEETEEKNKISLTKDVLPFIIPLSCILTGFVKCLYTKNPWIKLI